MKSYYNPVRVEFGRNSLEFLPRFIKNRKALLLTSQSFKKSGLIDDLCMMNKEIVKVVSEVKPNPTIAQVKDMRNKLDYEEFEIIVALGGGSVIDMAKALSPYIDKEELDFTSALIEGLNNFDFQVKPIIAVPTTAGTGSEVTSWGTVWDLVNKKKYSIAHEKLYCETALLDPTLHLSKSKELTLQTGLDSLSHSLEAIWNINTNPISNKYAISAAKTVVEVLPELLNNLSNIELRERMQIGSYQAGLAFSNTQTALAHAMSYYMTLEKDIAHGIATSITLPSIVEAAMKIEHCRKILIDIFGENPVLKLNQFFIKLGISTKLSDYQISKQDLYEIEKTFKNSARAQNSLVEFQTLKFFF